PSEQSVTPCADLIAESIDKSIDETLRLIFVFTSQDDEEDFTRRPRYGKISSAPHDLKHREQTKRGRNSHGDKTDDAKDGKECKRRSNPEPFQQTSRQENLHEHRENIYPDIEVREKDSAGGAIVKLVPGDIGQLKINKRS